MTYKIGKNNLLLFFLTLLIFRKKDEVVRRIPKIFLGGFHVSALRCDIHLAPDNRLNAIFSGRVIKFHCPEHVAMVGHCDGRHAKLFRPFKQGRMADRRIQQTVGSVKVKMYEIGGLHDNTKYQFADLKSTT